MSIPVMHSSGFARGGEVNRPLCIAVMHSSGFARGGEVNRLLCIAVMHNSVRVDRRGEPGAERFPIAQIAVRFGSAA